MSRERPKVARAQRRICVRKGHVPVIDEAGQVWCSRCKTRLSSAGNNVPPEVHL